MEVDLNSNTFSTIPKSPLLLMSLIISPALTAAIADVAKIRRSRGVPVAIQLLPHTEFVFILVEI